MQQREARGRQPLSDPRPQVDAPPRRSIPTGLGCAGMHYDWAMPQTLDIDFVSDVACPWCAIGLHALDSAIARTSDVVDVRLRFEPFELNPGMGTSGENIDAYLGGRYGNSLAQLAESREMVRDRAAAVGFAFNSSSRSRIYNTFDAHRLLHWAGLQGHDRQHQLKHALFKANFTEDRDVSDLDELVDVARSVGLDEAAAREVLTSDQYAEQVRAAEALWQARGIQGVPAIVINGKWLISGGQPPEVFEQALRGIAAELQQSEQRS